MPNSNRMKQKERVYVSGDEGYTLLGLLTDLQDVWNKKNVPQTERDRQLELATQAYYEFSTMVEGGRLSDVPTGSLQSTRTTEVLHDDVTGENTKPWWKKW